MNKILLLIDDLPEVATFGEDYFVDLPGFIIYREPNPDEAIKYFRGNRPDIVFIAVDVDLREYEKKATGFDFLDLMKDEELTDLKNKIIIYSRFLSSDDYKERVNKYRGLGIETRETINFHPFFKYLRKKMRI